MINGSLNDSVSARQPHTFRASYRSEKKEVRPFGAPGPIPGNFVSAKLERRIGYDPELAYVLSVIAGWSYSDGPTLLNQLKYYGLPGATVDEIAVLNPAMYIVATGFFVRSECGKVGILAFRGTEPTNIISWLTDADVAQRNFGGSGFVHRGFYANLRSIWEDVGGALHRATQPSSGPNGENGKGARAPLEALYITGHSLGAAMAVLAAAKIFKDEAPLLSNMVRGIYTFGQPAVGDKQFASNYGKLFGDRLYRHEYGHDAVPRLPPSTTGDFEHFGAVRVSFRANEGWEEPKTTSRQTQYLVVTALSVLGSFVGRRIPKLGKVEALLCKYSIFDDHSPARYIDASRAALVND
jgi:hypothetical protein